MKYKVGDRVRIVDNWVDGCHRHLSGGMDKWLGKVMTIRVVDESNRCYFMVEDKHDIRSGSFNGWYWFEPAIAGLAPFTKSDLKNGDVVMFRNGETAIYIDGFRSFATSNHWRDASSFNDNLTTRNHQYDIVKVSRPLFKHQCRLSVFATDAANIIYERKEPRKMTLAQVCAALGEEIEIVEEE